MAAIFYGQARASPEDAEKLSRLLGLSAESPIAAQMMGFPDRGRAGPMPPVEPLIYRLYEVVQNYGYAFKAVMNEKFGDGIMSAICFNSKVEKEVVRFFESFPVLVCFFFLGRLRSDCVVGWRPFCLWLVWRWVSDRGEASGPGLSWADRECVKGG